MGRRRADGRRGSPHGSVEVTNRYGATRVYAREWPEGMRCRVESVCGARRLFLAPELVARLRRTALTLCGAIGHRPFRELDKGVANSGQWATPSTIVPRGGHRLHPEPMHDRPNRPLTDRLSIPFVRSMPCLQIRSAFSVRSHLFPVGAYPMGRPLHVGLL
jgi:hypothetical protein